MKKLLGMVLIISILFTGCFGGVDVVGTVKTFSLTEELAGETFNGRSIRTFEQLLAVTFEKIGAGSYSDAMANMKWSSTKGPGKNMHTLRVEYNGARMITELREDNDYLMMTESYAELTIFNGNTGTSIFVIWIEDFM